jgi:hypothetical protein
MSTQQTPNQPVLDPRSLRPLTAALYVTAAMLVIVPLTELGAALGWQALPRMLQWRTGAVGLASGAVLTPTFGILIAVVTSFLFDHRWMQRILTVLAGLASLALFGVLIIFTLDALQIRPAVAAQYKHSYNVAMIKALTNFSITSFTLAVISISAFRTGRRRAKAPAPEKRSNMAESPLVLGGAASR